MTRRNRHNPLVILSVGLAAAFGMSAASGAGGVHYVDDDAPPAGDGLTWETAYRFLQDALSFASDPGNGVTEIRVGQGTYPPDRDETNRGGTGDREATFQLINGVAIKGGFAGLGAEDPDERDIEMYETVLTGDLAGDDGPSFANYDENSYHVVTGSGTDGSAVLEGFTITGGSAEGPADPANSGGGMLNVSGSPTVSNCTFAENRAVFGGGMENFAGSDPTVSSCTFSANASKDSGAGMDNFSSSSPSVSDCTFLDNAVDFELPSISLGGGMANFSGSMPTVTNCTFDGNSARQGGGMFNEHEDTNPIIIGCVFAGNRAWFGGGMQNQLTASPSVSQTSFLNNLAVSDGNFGGYGGAVENFSNGSITVINGLLAGNQADRSGGGVSNVAGSAMTLINCTIAQNSAAVSGSATYNSDEFGGHSTLAVENCIVYENGGQPIVDFMGASTTVAYSNVEGDYAGLGNIDTDPLYVDPVNGDYHLLPGSPCIDAADNTAVPAGVTTDLDGNPRFADDLATTDTGNGECPIVDMGSSEFPSSCPWDLDCDGNVGITDFLELLAAWGTDPGGPPDIDGDGNVGITDFLALLANWGPCR